LHVENRSRLSTVSGGPQLIPVGSHQCAFYRLHLRNQAGHDPARDVHVSLASLHGKNGEFELLGNLENQWLAWSNTELTNPNAERQTTVIDPGGVGTLDFVHLNQSTPGFMIIDIRPQPAGVVKPNFFRKAELTVDLVVSGQNFDPITYSIKIRHDGREWDWSKEGARSRLQLSGLKRATGRS
jgi:hypothetical protein